MTRMGLAAALAAFVVAFGGDAQADGEDGFNVIGVGWTWAQFDEPCGGDCAVLAFVGRHSSTDMEDMFGIANFTTGEFGFNEPTPIWNWRWRDSGIIGAALSRRIGAFSFGPLRDALHAELEVGLAQRFGEQTETEGWVALYGRWTKFPWNACVYTTVAVSTGLNYASGISTFERRRSGNGEGSRLLHYLSPEITFASPDRRELELVFRLHHRSGGGRMFGENGIFNGVAGGAHFGAVGIRYRY